MTKRKTYEPKNYYLSESESFKIYMLKIFLLVSLAAIVMDIWMIQDLNKLSFLGLKSIVFIILSLVYIIFPRYISLAQAIYISIVSVTILIVLSLGISGINQYFGLFLLAVIPVYSFFFLGAYVGLIWSLSVIFFLTLSMVIEMLNAHHMFFNANTIAEIAIAYISLTYLYYHIELRRSASEKSLYDLLEKKTILLKEVHHRSKNNLQTVIGLLESQAMRIKNDECKKVLTSQSARLKTMSMAHENLSGSMNYEKIEMGGYLNSIVKSIDIMTECDIVSDFDKMYLSMEDAMNIGLFFNEALSNAVEHAYPNEKKGKIEVALKGYEYEFEVTIRDYGIGFDTHKIHNSLGLLLMEDICQFFQNSVLTLENDHGTVIRAHFKMENS